MIQSESIYDKDHKFSLIDSQVVGPSPSKEDNLIISEDQWDCRDTV